MLVVLALLPRGGSAQTEGVPPALCGWSRWSTPVPVSPADVVLRSPALAISTEYQVVTGADYRFPEPRLAPGPDATLMGDPFFFALRPPRPDPIGAPPGEFQFLHPRAAFSESGVLHLVWAEAEAPISTRRETFSPRLSDLWYASIQPDEEAGWSEPTHLYGALDIEWNARSSALLLNGGSGRDLQVLVGVTERGASGAVSRLLRLTYRPRTGETAVDQVVEGRVAYLDVAGDLLAYVGAHREFGQNTLHVIRARDDGLTWGSPVVLDPVSQRLVTRVWLFEDTRQRSHLLWLSAPVDDVLSGPRIAHHYYAPAGSDAWTDGPTLELPPGLNRATASLDACDRIHLVSEVTAGSVVPQLVHHLLSRDGWSEAAGPAGGLLAMHPVLARGPDRRDLFMAWTEARPDMKTGQAVPRVYLSQLLSPARRTPR